MAQEWTDRIVTTQMAVNNDFKERLQRSELSRREWGLVMTAVDFEIEYPNDPDRARIVANSENLPATMSDLNQVANLTSIEASNGTSASSGGLLDSITTALGFTGMANGVDEEKRDQAEQLVSEYATALQQQLEHCGTWDEIRTSVSNASEA